MKHTLLAHTPPPAPALAPASAPVHPAIPQLVGAGEENIPDVDLPPPPPRVLSDLDKQIIEGYKSDPWFDDTSNTSSLDKQGDF